MAAAGVGAGGTGLTAYLMQGDNKEQTVINQPSQPGPLLDWLTEHGHHLPPEQRED